MNRCPNCGACKECGHGGQHTAPWQYPTYPVYPTYPPTWWGVIPPYTTGGSTYTFTANTGGNYSA